MSRARWWRPFDARIRAVPVLGPEAREWHAASPSASVRRSAVRIRGFGTVLSLAGTAAVVLTFGGLIRSAGPAAQLIDPAGARLATPASEGVTSSAGVSPSDVVSRDWMARAGDGTWLVGRPGRSTMRLATTEIGLAIGDGWLITTDRSSYGQSVAWRAIGATETSRTGVDVVPASIALTASTAYVTGFDRTTSGDPGLYALSLDGGAVSQLVKPTGGTHPRSVVVSPDESTVVSATCDDAEGCDLTTLSAASGAARAVVHAPGYLRASTSSVAIVGADPADWIAAIDLSTGRELWRRAALEMWNGYTTSDGRLVQAALQLTSDGPVFVVDVISDRDGAAHTVFRAPVGHGIGLWPELSSDVSFAIGPAYSLEDGLAHAKAAPISVRVLSLADGHQMGSETILGSN